MSLDKIGVAKRIAQELKNGYYVNLGIGIPTLVANYVPKNISVEFQSENGILGMGGFPIDGEEDADREAGDEHGAASVADEGQGEALGGDQGDRHEHVDHRLQTQEQGDAEGQEATEVIPSVHRRADSAREEEAEEGDDHEHTHEAELLGEDREDEVRVPLREVAREGLATEPEALAREPARTDGDQGVHHLDLIRYLFGEPSKVYGKGRTFGSEIEVDQCERLRMLKDQRNQEKVNKSLDNIIDACNRDNNLMPFIIDAVRTKATLGEIISAMKSVFGEWEESAFF